MTHDDVSDENNLIVVSYDPGRSKHSLFDFKTLELSFPLASAFRRGFIALYGHCSAGTQRTNWAKTRKFAKFLRDADLADKVQLPETVLSEFYSWLNASGAKSITAYAALTNCHAILSYCERNNRRLLSRKTRLILPPKPAQLPTRRELLPDDLVKKILAICHANIVAAEERLALGRRLLAGETRTCHEALQARIIHELLAIGRGELPTRTEIRKISRKTMDRIDSIGGMREISRLIWLCNEDMFSFYLAILIQTSGNPSAILEIERDCITPHPLRSDLERVVWIKRRSHAEQHVEAPVGRSWSAPNLIRRIEALNECLIAKCAPPYRNKVFLSYQTSLKDSAVPSTSRIAQLRAQFIQSNDLPAFTFSALRRAGAVAHHRVSGTLQAPRTRLNHVSANTTFGYTRDCAQTLDSYDLTIRRFQGLMLRSSLGSDPNLGRTAEPGLSTSTPADTVFGFRCRDPFAGVADGSRVGHLCLQFQKCATCPGALIPLDDVEVVARLLGASMALGDARERAIQEGWMPRFRSLYETTLRILESEILPAVSKEVRARAFHLVDQSTIPCLE